MSLTIGAVLALLLAFPVRAHYLFAVPDHEHTDPAEADADRRARYHEAMLRSAGYDKTPSKEEMASLLAPFDLRTSPERDRLDANIRVAFQTTGMIRFDESSNRVLIRVSEKENRPMTRLEVLSMLRMVDAQRRHGALERIALNAGPGAAPTAQNRDAIALMVRLEGAQLPPELTAAIRASQAAQALQLLSPLLPLPAQLMTPVLGTLTDKAVASNAQDAFRASTRYFDQSRGLSNLASSALPARNGVAPAAQPAYFDATERRLGVLLTGEVTALFRENPAGKDLLTGLDGHMPAIALVGIQAKRGGGAYGLPAAFYQPTSHSVSLLSDQVYTRLRARALELGVPDRVADSWTDPRRMVEFLAGDDDKAAALRRFLVRDQQVVLAHEFTHAWQNVRDRVMPEMGRRNVGSAPIEYEQEAFRVQNQYFHHMLAAALRRGDRAELQAVMSNSNASSYVTFLSDPDRFLQSVVSGYQTQPQGASNFPQVSELQRMRGRAATADLVDALASVPQDPLGGLQGAGTHLLRLLGRSHGDAALAEAAPRHARFMSDFFGPGGAYHGMRREGMRDMGRLQAGVGQPVSAILWFQAARTLAADAAQRGEADKLMAVTMSAAADQILSPTQGAPPISPTAMRDAFGPMSNYYNGPSVGDKDRVEGYRALARLAGDPAIGRPDVRFSYLVAAASHSRSKLGGEGMTELTRELGATQAALRDGSWLTRDAGIRLQEWERFDLAGNLSVYYDYGRVPTESRPRWLAPLLVERASAAGTYLDRAESHPAGSAERNRWLGLAERYLPHAPRDKTDGLRRRLTGLREAM